MLKEIETLELSIVSEYKNVVAEFTNINRRN